MSYPYYQNNAQNVQFYQPHSSASSSQPHNLNNGYNVNYNVNSNSLNSTPANMGVMGTMDTQFQDYKYGANGAMGDTQLSQGILAAFSTSGYPGELPLLEELGINFTHIKMKTLAVLNPLGGITPDIMTDCDLAGPILFCMLFGTLLLLTGKVHFGYIYGVGIFGTASLHYLFKFMANEQIDIMRSASVIGYCLLPLNLISIIGVFTSLDNILGYALSAFAVLWCTYSASGFFVAVLKLQNVRPLIAYPLAMFYSVFALMAIFVEKSP